MAGLLAREHARAEHRLNDVRGGVLLVLAVAAALYAPRLTTALDIVNVCILAPMIAWTVAQHFLVHRPQRDSAVLSTANPLVDITAVSVLLVGYGLIGIPDLAVKSPIFLAYFGILASRPFTSSTRRAGIAAAIAVIEYAGIAALFILSSRLTLRWSPLDTLTATGTSVLDEGAKVLPARRGRCDRDVRDGVERAHLRRALSAQVERSEEEHALAIRLQEADKLAALGALSATLAHEVNNPLASILATAQLLQESSLTEEQHADVERGDQRSKADDERRA